MTVTGAPVPTVTVSPASSAINSGQSLSVPVTVTGSGGTATGNVTLSGGGYTSSAQALASGAHYVQYSCEQPECEVPSHSQQATAGDSNLRCCHGNSDRDGNAIDIHACSDSACELNRGSSAMSRRLHGPPLTTTRQRSS